MLSQSSNRRHPAATSPRRVGALHARARWTTLRHAYRRKPVSRNQPSGAASSLRSGTWCLFIALIVPTIAGCGGNTTGPKGSITVFAASQLNVPLTTIAKQFGSDNPGATVTVRSGVSRDLFNRLRALDPHAPAAADVFATSDATVIHDLSGNNELQGNDEVTGNPTYAQIFINDPLVIVTAPSNPRGIKALRDLAKPPIKLALGSSQSTVGLVARTTLNRAQVQAHPAVTTKDPASAITAVTSGKADASIVYASDARALGSRVSTISIPKPVDLGADYLAALVLPIRHAKLAEKFITYLFSAKAQETLTDGGFRPIDCKGPVTNCAQAFPK
jgi:molybdate transport system substrate-binding protein